MKNLKKLNREQQRKINGGAFEKCSATRPCFIGFCCWGVCMEYDCIEE
ncbi:hypothetical protein JET18_18985 [Chryseobacterium sp. L7]|uniref:Bacteriocin n=1 Tax=Chryseobacterium endalhagicum TaxID=2797638 RepID=A0ABS1QKU7_9FLAO|nr:hypothetical protein [Chryseobacterium endalhagicum]MBL1222947.1 hypothetical protein [Chryseobacterium endalhagicum]